MAAALGEDQFSATLLYALEQLGTPNISLKDEQKCSIRAAFSGKDVFVCLPTGFGKSLCYQVLPFTFDHKAGLLGRNVVVVVSPLKALMADQIKSLQTVESKLWSYHLAPRTLLQVILLLRSQHSEQLALSSAHQKP